jgi:ureidoacrylate peracid hydrolase
MIAVPSRPSPLGLDLRRTALLVIDMQNDFGAPEGMFDRAGIDITGIQASVAPTRRVLAAARAADVPVIFLKMEHPPDLSNAGPEDGPHRIKHLRLRAGEEILAPDGSRSRILVEGTWNTEILEELQPEGGDVVISKHRYSGFFGTKLDEILRDLGVKYLVVTGCTTSICVESTVRDAMFRDYTCLVLEDCTAEPLGSDLPRTNHEASLLNIERLLGWVSSSEAFLRALAQSPTSVSVR